MTPTSTSTSNVSAAGRVKQVLAGVVLLIATIGVPAALSVSVGWPLPPSPGFVERLPLLLSQPIPSSAVVDVLAVIAWFAWLHFAAGILVELINATTRRGRPQLRLPFGGPSHDLARSLVVTALLISAAAPLAAGPLAAGPLAAAPLPAPPSAAATAAPTVASTTIATSTTRDVADEPGAATGTAAASAGGDFRASAGATTRTVTATTASSPGDGPAALAERDAGASAAVPELVVPAPAAGRYACLWDIAEQQLGDGTRWTEIYGLNVGRTQPDGQTLTDPDLIRPGWRLVLPPHTPHTAGNGPSATPVQAWAPVGHLVVPGDTLWAIAETELGDGARYGELAHAAATITQPDGQVLRDPDVLQPGWTIPLPAQAPTVDEAPTQDGHPTSTPGSTADGPARALPQSDALPAPPHPVDEVSDARGSAGVAEGGEGRGGRWGSADTSAGSSAPQGPQQEDAASSDRVDDMGEAGDSDADEVAPAWALPGLSGAGTMLAGALLLLLRQHRRRQSRLRRPGRTLAVPDTQHVVVEKSVRAHTHTATTIERLDQILRRLAAARLHSDEALPAVTSVTLDRDGVTVHLAKPSPPADPWTAGPDSSSWHLPGDVDLDQVGPRVPDQPAPFPLLVTVGVTPAGATTMLNLEHLGIATVTGDRQRGQDLLRYIAAEVGCNPWSEAVRAHCVGIAGELGPLNPERIRVTPAPDRGDTGRVGPGPGGSVDPVADLTADAVAAIDRSDELDMDVPDARIRQAGDETWPPHLLLLDASQAPAALDTLADLIRTHPSRTGTTVLVLDAPDPAAAAAAADRVQSSAPAPAASAAASDPTLHISGAADLTVTWRTGGVVASVSAAGLSAAEAQGCAALYALGAPDAPMPTPHADSHGWQAYADAAGALTAAHTLPRHDPSVAGEEREATVGWGDDAHGPDDLEHEDDGNQGRGDEGRGDKGRGDKGRGNEGRGNEGRGNDEEEREGPAYNDGGDERGPDGEGYDAPDFGARGREPRRTTGAASVLGAPDEEYLDIAASTRADLDILAPSVPEEVRRAVAENDPGLDDDLAAWFAESSRLPRLTLLGPVGARTRGVPVTKRKPYYTELLTYLATRPHGATPEEVAAAFDITATKARGYVATVRDWLGTNPRTGRPHIPDARHSPAAEHRGVGVYEVQDLLVDADLFRRLRLRGETRGPDGIQDMKRALTLVTGPPFSKLRPGGWTWLVEGDRIDQHMLCAVVDIAHIVTTHLLHAGDLSAARATAELAALAAPDEEIPRLDLAAVAMASGHRRTATDIIRGDICNRADDAGPPDELSARTQAILDRHGWLTDHRQAAS